MVAEKKRPRGLKGSAMAKAHKKTKVDEPTNPSEIPENAQTVVIDKVVEEGDEVGEAAALFESAVEKLGMFIDKSVLNKLIYSFEKCPKTIPLLLYL